MSRRAATALLLAVTVMAAAGVAMAAGPPAIARQAIAGGGGVVSGGAFTLRTTVGQSTAGHVIDGDTDLCAGYWCMPIRYDVLLPLVVRG